MTPRIRMTGVFLDDERCAQGIVALRAAGFARPRAFSPFTSEKILRALGAPRSPVRLWVLLGGITGCASGFALTIGLSAEYPHVTAGMPVVSIPPFVIIAFELTILCGALAGLTGFLVHGRFPAFVAAPGYGPQFSDDRFGIIIECATGDRRRVHALLDAAGAVEVQSEEL